jgi:UDP-glucose 6-dehydrogenase
VYMNLIYDLVNSTGGEWEEVREALANEPRIGESHTQPIHSSGRGAGGHCFIKDFEIFRQAYMELVGDKHGSQLVNALRDKNIELLKGSNKDKELVEGVYGKADNI